MTSAPSAAAAHETEILRVLKVLAAPETELLVTEKLADAVLVLNPAGGRPTRLGAVARDLAESLVLRGFIAGRRGKALTRYRITQAGRGEMMRLVAERESRRAAVTGRAEDADAADGAEALFGAAAGGAGAARSGSSADHRAAGARSRTAGAESPLLVLARRKAPDGKPFLGEGEVAAGFRFRTSFEIARMDAGFTRDWDRLIAGKVSGSGPAGAGGSAPTRRLDAARDLEAALRRLGPDLSEVAILALCEELGMEAVERRLGLSARAGKNILKIALRMLERHYHSAGSAEFDMIG